MDLMGALGEMSRDDVICFVSHCQHESGGFRASIGHDPSLLCTLSAIQVAVYLELYADAVVNAVECSVTVNALHYMANYFCDTVVIT